jgi:hypothetical protein
MILFSYNNTAYKADACIRNNRPIIWGETPPPYHPEPTLPTNQLPQPPSYNPIPQNPFLCTSIDKPKFTYFWYFWHSKPFQIQGLTPWPPCSFLMSQNTELINNINIILFWKFSIFNFNFCFLLPLTLTAAKVFSVEMTFI